MPTGCTSGRTFRTRDVFCNDHDVSKYVTELLIQAPLGSEGDYRCYATNFDYVKDYGLMLPCEIVTKFLNKLSLVSLTL